MADDFAKTADRMMFDARTLREAGSFRNACYLAGYVVECTLKVLLDKAGMAPEHTHDLESLHDEVAQLLLLGNTVVARYGDPASLAPTLLQQIAPPKPRKGRSPRYFCHWDPEHRYDGSRWDSAQISDDYLREADKSIDVIIQMSIDGVL
jgi:hypothetical protein